MLSIFNFNFDFYFLIYFTAFIFFINMFFVVTIVFVEKRNPTSTWAWILTLTFLPILGFILYTFLGQNLRKKKVFSKKEKRDKYQKLLFSQKKYFYYAEKDTTDLEAAKYNGIIHLNLKGADSPFTYNNDIEIYTDGKQKFESLIKSLESAKKYIHMEYYIFRNDKIGKRILKILEHKAAEGVEVKFLYDGVGAMDLPEYVFKNLKKNGGKVACFFPSILPYVYFKINYRNHRKIAIIDAKDAFVGGFNIGDEYLGRDKAFGYWRDTHIKLMGDSIDSLQRQFILDWNFASGEQVAFDPKYFPTRNDLIKTPVQVVSSGPDSTWTSIKDGLFKMINSANKSVYIQTPYFVPDEAILESLKVAALSGIDVRLMIPAKPDHEFVYWASYAYVGEMLNAGVKCYLYNKGFIHSKTIVIDSSISSVGTANIDVRSFNLNFEINAFIYDKEFGQKMENIFLDDLSDCTEITLEGYNNRNLITKIKESIFRLFSPIL